MPAAAAFGTIAHAAGLNTRSRAARRDGNRNEGMANGEQALGNTMVMRPWRGLGRLILESFAAGTAVSLVLAFAVFLMASQARAAAGATDGLAAVMAPMDDSGGRVEDEIRGAAIPTAFDHHVATYMSLLAVDARPAPPATRAAPDRVAGNLPQSTGTVTFGALPQPATPAELDMALGLVALLTAAIVWRLGAHRVATPTLRESPNA